MHLLPEFIVPYFMLLSFSNTLVESVLELDTLSVLFVLHSIAFLRIIDTICSDPSLIEFIFFPGWESERVICSIIA